LLLFCWSVVLKQILSLLKRYPERDFLPVLTEEAGGASCGGQGEKSLCRSERPHGFKPLLLSTGFPPCSLPPARKPLADGFPQSLNAPIGNKFSVRFDWGAPLVDVSSRQRTLQEQGVTMSLDKTSQPSSSLTSRIPTVVGFKN